MRNASVGERTEKLVSMMQMNTEHEEFRRRSPTPKIEVMMVEKDFSRDQAHRRSQSQDQINKIKFGY